MNQPRILTLRLLSLGVLAVAAVSAWSHRTVPAPRLSSDSISFAATPAAVSATPGAQQRAKAAYAKLPLHFELNRGQTHRQVKLLARGSGYTLFLTSTEAVLNLVSKQNSVLRMKLVGGNLRPRVTGLDELPGKVNSLTGNDPGKWCTGVPTYARVRYEQVYPGVDLVYYGSRQQLEYDFVVAPGADPAAIALRFEGAGSLEVDGRGDLVLHTAGGQVRQHRPLVYQEVNGTRQEIPGAYVIQDGEQVGFQLGVYDRERPLVIDPVLTYSTYHGGGSDFASHITVDPAGNVYVAGDTPSPDFPTSRPFQAVPGGDTDAFVAKLSPTGSALVYATYLGGSGNDQGSGVAVDASGSVYVSGATASSNFPTVNPLQPQRRGTTNAFIAKIAGSAIDIRPGEFPNPVNLKSQGMLPVGILSTPEFNALAVDAGTVTLGDPRLPAAAPPTRAIPEDVDGDGDLDLLLLFRIPDLVNSRALQPNSTEAALRGRTQAGGPFVEGDSVTIVP